MTSISIDPHDNAASGALARVVQAILATDRSAIQTLLRVVLGVVMLPHGLQKTIGWFGGHGFEGTMGYFGSIGIPAFFAFLAIFAESAGALALIAGVTTRVAAFGIAVNMLVAGFMHRGNGFLMNWSGQQAGEGFEYHILAIGIAVALIVRGAGRFSIDRLLTKG